jgi:hypothetical protein
MGAQILGHIKFEIEGNGAIWTQDIEIIRRIDFDSGSKIDDGFSIKIGTRFLIENIGMVEVTNISTTFMLKDLDYRKYGILMNGIGEEFPWNSLIIFKVKKV